MELDKRPTDLNELLGELVDFYNPQAQLSRIQLRLKKGDGEVVAPVDSRLMKQAVLNLMINATHAMQDKGGGDLILSAGRQDGEATIDVIDTGAGMAPEVAEKIFQAYYSTKKGGTGLGLPMARRIVEEHGGRMTLRTEVGKGTDFSIHLPLN
jgi:signal transduction histidine kinase